MAKGNVKEDGKEKYRRKPYTSKQLLEINKEMKRLCEKLLQDGATKQLPPDEGIQRTHDICSILVDVGSKGANLELIDKILREPLTISDPERQNPHLLRHIHLCDDYERLILSPQWKTVLEKHHERGEAYTKKQRQLKSAAGRLFRHLEPLDDALYYSDHTRSMYGRDLNIEISIKKAEINAFIDLYLKFLASQLSMSSYQSYDKKEHLKAHLQPTRPKRGISREVSKILNNKIVALFKEFERIGYSRNSADKITGELLHLIYPHLPFLDPSLIRQRRTYKPRTRTR